MDYLMPQGRFAQARQLRDSIVRAVLTESMKPRATVGEAQGMFPDFPTPPGSTKPGPQVETTEAMVPSTFDVDQVQGPASLQPRMLETQVPDPNTLLPRSYQGLLEAKLHRSSLQVPRTGVTDAELKMHDRNRLAMIRSGGPELYPGETNDLESTIGLYEKGPKPGTPKADIQKHEAEIKGADAAQEARKVKAEIDKLEADAALSRDRSDEINTLVGARLNELVARARMENQQAGAQGRKLENAESRLALLEAGKDLDMLKYLSAAGLIDTKGQKVFLNAIISRIGKDLEIMGQDPNALQKLLGLEPKGITAAPRSKVDPIRPTVPSAKAPTLTPPPQAETTEATDDEAADRAAIKAMGQSMKEGESKVYKGAKYTRKGGKLVKEKE